MEIIKPDYKLIRLLIDYFTARIINPELYTEICEVARKYHLSAINGINKKAWERIQFGYFDANDFAWFITQTGRFGDNEKKIHVHYLDTLFNKLAELQIFKKPGSIFDSSLIYTLNDEYLPKNLIKNDLLINILLGFNHILDRYTNSIFKIEHLNKGYHSIVNQSQFIFLITVANTEYRVVLTS